MRFILICLTILSLAAPLAADPKGRIVVTVGGDLAAPNLPARGEDDPGFFKYLEITYPAGYGFDDHALGHLKQHELTVPYDGQPEMTFRGPLLADVLKAAGAKGNTVRAVALDGYQAELPMEMIESLDPILATHANGKPLAIGGYGPTAIVFPTISTPEIAEEVVSLQVWALVFIGIE